MSIILVGEIGINHNGNMDITKELIEVAKLAKLNYIKFQKRDINSVYTKEYLDSTRESPWGTTQREQKERLEFNKNQYEEINNYLKDTKLGWFASPWDAKSVKFLADMKVPFIKIASAKITDLIILEEVKNTNIPVIISTGMSTKEEVDACVEYLGDQLIYILSCKSTYPTKNEDMNMNFIKTLKKEYPKHKIGFSNHNSGIQFCLVAAALGAEMIEFHMTLDRAMYGSDQAASIETAGVLKIGSHIRAVERAMGTGDWIITPEEEKIRKKLR
jgi:N-acetylneuraminate synthase